MDVADPLAELQKLVVLASKKSGGVGSFAKQLLPLVEQLSSKTAPSRTIRRKGAEYLVEVSDLGETLAEHRLSGKAMPFRCSKAIYDGVVQVLATAKSPLNTNQITELAAQTSGIDVAQFQVRIVLRLWLNVSPSLVVRQRARYRSVDRERFAVAAATLWVNLRKK